MIRRSILFAAALLALSLAAQPSEAGGLARLRGCGPAGCGVPACGPHGCHGGLLHGHGLYGNAGLAAAQNPALLNWHGGYYHTLYGAPVALVVPPTAFSHTEFGWGVGNKRVSPIYPQFGRQFPGYAWGGQGFRPTPQWPSDTTQFGVYYVRGPW